MKIAWLDEDGAIPYPPYPPPRSELIVLWGTGGGVENEILCAAGTDGHWQPNVRIPALASKGEVVWRAGERESVEGVNVALRD